MIRPKVIVSSHASVDGRITLAPDTLLLYGDPRWSDVAGPTEGIYARIMQTYHPQALLEGSGSLVRDGDVPDALPALSLGEEVESGDYLPDAVVNQPGRAWLTVVDSRGRVRWAFKEYPGEEWKGWHILVLVSAQTPPEYLAYLRREEIPYLLAGEEKVDLPLALEKMKCILGITCLVSTAGGRLNGALLQAGLVDEFEVVFFPALIGGRGTPALFDGSPLKENEPPAKMKLRDYQVEENGFVRLHYEILAAVKNE